MSAQPARDTVMSTPTKSGLTRAAMKRPGAAELVTKEAAVEQLYDVIQAAVQKR
ncbi:MAG TPA: hypothetical protein VLE46_04650 [Nitrospira sp.]|nr:hypothetical protein [Nitrospira sp.]